MLEVSFIELVGRLIFNSTLGGYDSNSDSNLEYLTNSRAIILTFVISGEAVHRDQVLAWEKEFGIFMKEIKMDNLTVSYNCDRALEVSYSASVSFQMLCWFYNE